jgi:hypothetical protein
LYTLSIRAPRAEYLTLSSTPLRIPRNPVSMLHADQDLATRQAGIGGPTGFSSHGRQTARRIQVPVDVLGARGRSVVLARPQKLYRDLRSAPILKTLSGTSARRSRGQSESQNGLLASRRALLNR